MKKFIRKFYPIGIALIMVMMLWFGVAHGSQIINNTATPTMTSSTNGNFQNVTTTNLVANSSTFSGLTTFLSNPLLSACPPTSVLFATTTGQIACDPSHISWDYSNRYFGIGSSTPNFSLTVSGTTYISGLTTIGNTSASTSEHLDISGFTKFGTSFYNPPIKIAFATGTTAAFQGFCNGLYLDTSIASSTILGLTVEVEWSSPNAWIGPGYQTGGGYQFDYYLSNGEPLNLAVCNVGGNSGNILSKPFRAVIFYVDYNYYH